MEEISAPDSATPDTEPDVVASVESDVDREESASSEEMFGDEISPDELGIDLEALALAAPNIAGRAKPNPTLTDSGSKRPVGRPPKEDEGLFAWCEQYAYTPGVEYLKLQRSFPKLWEGITINGFIEDIYEPIDEHWLADRWGGGAYQLDIYQRDSTGRSRKSGTKFVEISGLPKAFMGHDGIPHELPSRQNPTSSRKSSDVLRRRMGIGKFRGRDEREYEEAEDSRPPVPRNLDKPLTDASTLYKVMQDSKKSDNEALGVLREAQKDVHTQMQATAQQQADMYRTLLDQQKDEMTRIREEGRMAAESSSAPFKEMLQFMATQGASSSSRDSLDVLRSAHDTAVTQLTKDHSSHLDDIRRSYEGRISQMVGELNRLRSEYTQNSERIRSDYLEKEKSAKDDAFRQYQTQMEMVRTQTSELRERHRDELTTTLREKNETIASMRQDALELRTSLNQKDHDARVSLIERENTLRSEYAERERTLNGRIAALEAESRTALVEERQRLKEEFEDRYEAKLQAAQASFDARVESITQSAELKVQTAESATKSSAASLRRELQAQYEGQTIRLESELGRVKGEHQVKEQLALERSRMEQESAQREREQQRLLMENSAQSREALAEMAKKQLESRLREVTKDLDAQRKENVVLSGSRSIEESSDPFEQLERLNQIKDKLRKHGFTDGAEADKPKNDDSSKEEEKPKDFLGKIMHYGPKFVGPILERIDAATSVAQQSLHQQQAQEQAQELLRSRQALLEHQQQAGQQREAAEQRELALRERREMLQRRRMEREFEIAQERGGVAQDMARRRDVEAAPVASPIPETSFEIADARDFEYPESSSFVAEEVSSIPPGDDMENDGYTQLADYLQKSLSEGKQPSGIVKELKMARMMGMFSQEVLRDVLAENFDDLVSKLGSIHPDLKRPKSRIALKTIVEGMK